MVNAMQCNGDVHREGLVRIRYGLAKLDAEEEERGVDAEKMQPLGAALLPITISAYSK